MARRDPVERWAEKAPRASRAIEFKETPDNEVEQRQMFRRILGDDVYLKLLEYSGGCRLYVPHEAGRSKLALIFGLEATQTLAAHFAGNYITIPLDREFRVMALHQQNKSARQIALTLGISEKGAYKMLWRVRDREKLSVEK